MNYSQIRAFQAVATEGSFTKAARLLGVSQPAVTIQVKALEEGYGVTLFDRRGHQVTVTDLGKQLLDITRRVFGLDQEAEELLSAARELRGGYLKVGADGPYFVMGFLAEFIARYPGVRVAVTMGNSQAVLQDLFEFRTDVAVLPRIDDDQRLHAIPHTRQPVVVFVPSGHEWANRRSIKLAELEGRAMVLREEGSSTRQVFEKALAEAGVEPRVVLEIGSREALQEAVAAGLGIGVISKAELGRDPSLRAIRISDARLESREYVVCLNERRNLRTVQAFLNIVGEQKSAERS
ncbi:MAG: LysR family transcriptional regulator [Proteobacteria bacterium]|nr:LysR family transcriptional regulator [Pseudomonadota bacterium]